MTSFIYRLLTQCNQVGAQIFSSRKLHGFREIFIFQFINSELRPGKDCQDSIMHHSKERHLVHAAILKEKTRKTLL